MEEMLSKLRHPIQSKSPRGDVEFYMSITFSNPIERAKMAELFKKMEVSKEVYRSIIFSNTEEQVKMAAILEKMREDGKGETQWPDSPTPRAPHHEEDQELLRQVYIDSEHQPGEEVRGQGGEYQGIQLP